LKKLVRSIHSEASRRAAASNGCVKLTILAAALFAWTYIAEYKLLIGLESSQVFFERMP
jgi:hypothetical protein